MDQNMLERAEKYLDLYEAIKGKTHGDDRLALTILQEVTKDRRMDEMRGEREQRNGDPATPKQLQFLKKLGVEVKPGITKREASMRIDEALMKEED